MENNERKLSKSEQKRRDVFDKLCNDMYENGYTKTDNIIDVKTANIAGTLIMLPFIALIILVYYIVNRNADFHFNIPFGNLYLLAILLILVHELIHGITWAIFAKNGLKSISFGVIWKFLTPYCTCNEPLTKYQYAIGGLMPTLILGFGLAIVSIYIHSPSVLILSLLMTFGGGGDFLILYKIIKYKSKNDTSLYYDHPYECGFVIFEK